MEQYKKEIKQKTQEFTQPIIDYLLTQNPTQQYVSKFSNVDIEVNSIDHLQVKEKGLFGKIIADISISKRTGTIDCETNNPTVLQKEKLMELTPTADIHKYFLD